jgi:K+-sensing histidine kinase KdpD
LSALKNKAAIDLRATTWRRGASLTDLGLAGPELVGSLFERFTRGATPSSEGAGLGLSIAQSYDRAHGGTLTYEPAKPHGASFRLILPVAPI